MQANRMRRLLKTTLPRMQPPCSRVDSNRGSMMFAQNVQQRLTSTVVGKTSDDSNLVARDLKFAKITMFSAQVAARTLAAISDSKKAKGLYVAPSLADNVKHIFDFFPFSPEVLQIFSWQFSISEQCRSWKIFLSPIPRY